MNEWDRQKGEKNLWYDRFTQFRLMPSSRSILAVYNDWREKVGKGGKAKRVPSSWANAAEKWRWRRRAEAWDEAERQRLQREYEAERLEWRERRRQMLQGFFSQLAKALQKFDPQGATLGQLTQAVRTVIQELRAEYDDLPIERRDVTTGGKPLFDIEEWKQRAEKQRQAVEEMEGPGCGTQDA